MVSVIIGVCISCRPGIGWIEALNGSQVYVRGMYQPPRLAYHARAQAIPGLEHCAKEIIACFEPGAPVDRLEFPIGGFRLGGEWLEFDMRGQARFGSQSGIFDMRRYVALARRTPALAALGIPKLSTITLTNRTSLPLQVREWSGLKVMDVPPGESNSAETWSTAHRIFYGRSSIAGIGIDFDRYRSADEFMLYLRREKGTNDQVWNVTATLSRT